MIKKILIIIGLIVVILFIMGRLTTNAQEVQTCPDGSYDIGASKDDELICKLEPTGCPYGDSIPLGPECDKHAPQVKAEVKEVVDIPVIDDIVEPQIQGK